MKQSVILFILLFCGAVLAQEADLDQTVGEPDEAAEADTLEEELEEDLEFEEADEDTLAPEAAVPVEIRKRLLPPDTRTTYGVWPKISLRGVPTATPLLPATTTLLQFRELSGRIL